MSAVLAVICRVRVVLTTSPEGSDRSPCGLPSAGSTSPSQNLHAPGRLRGGIVYDLCRRTLCTHHHVVATGGIYETWKVVVRFVI